jgi:hypothetical protein
VVLLAFRPVPFVLSAALPLKVAGTVAARKTLPLDGVVTEAVVGTVASIRTPVVFGGVNVSPTSALPASLIVPPFRVIGELEASVPLSPLWTV